MDMSKIYLVAKKISTYVVVALLLANHLASAQGTTNPALPTITNIVPPSPTAASLGRFGEVPVSLYTGVPNISIPLYKAKNSSGSGEVPIALNYHASGIRVDDMGSWVGLGWALDCGGVVTRTIHGMPDEEARGYLNEGAQLVDDYMARRLSPRGLYAMQTDASDGKLDLEPDVYSFNFAGHTGQFVFDKTGRPALMPQQGLQIEVRTDTAGFKITDENGTVFHFLTTETSTTNTIPNRRAAETYYSSWYLTRISPVIGPSIKFIYSSPRDVTYPGSITENKQVLIGGSPAVGGIELLPSETYVTASVVNLQQIILADQSISFYTSDRGDILNMSKLDSVTVATSSGTVVKQYALQYQSNSRVFLAQVQEKFNRTQVIPPYLFTYKSVLPPVYTKQQDHWGYYNGKSGSPATLIPTTTVSPGGASSLVIAGTDRSPDANLMQAGSLTSITYPTGGKTAFEYEPHDYGYVGTQRNAAEITTRPRSVSARGSNLVEHDSAQFRLATSQVVSIGTSLNIGPTGRAGSYVSSATVTYRCISCDATTRSNLVYIADNQSGQQSHSVQLPIGLYRIYAEYLDPRPGTSGYASIWADFQDSTGVTVNKMSGGLRIRKVTSSANNGGPASFKQYTYRLTGDPIRSSGCAVFGLPTYQYRHRVRVFAPQTRNVVENVYLMLTSTSGAQPSMTQGASVGYSEVTVLEGGNDVNGKTINKFTSPKTHSDAGIHGGFPFAPSNSFDYRRGKLLETVVYRRRNNIDEPVSRTRYGYSLMSARTGLLSQQIMGLKFGRELKETTQGGDLDEFQGQNYYYTSEWVYPTTKLERRYASSGDTTAYTESILKYRYANPTHQQLTAQEQSAGDGSSAVNTYRYPLDFAVPTGVSLDEPSTALQTLVAKHVLNVPIEQQSWRRRGVDSVLVSAQLAHYAGVYPKKVWQLDSATPLAPSSFTSSTIQATGVFQQDFRYREAMLFEQYDAFGNVLQQRRAHERPTSYLWSYNNTLPVAQIKNATYTEVQQHLQALGFTFSALTTDAQLRTALNQLRQSWPQAQLTSFIHKPLVGLTSQTDPSGRTTAFEYDGLGRLQRIRDDQGRVITEQQYHYARP